VTLAPSRCAQILKVSATDRGGAGGIVDRAFDVLARGYSKVLARSLRRPLLVLATALVLFGISLKIFTSLPKEFVPSQDQSRLMIRLQTQVSSDITETDRAFRKVEQFLSTRPEVNRYFGVVGGGGGGVNNAFLFVTMKPPKERKLTQSEFAGVLRKELNSYPGLRAIAQDLSQAGFTAQRGFPVEFSVRGSNWEKLVEEFGKVRDTLAQSGFVVDVDSDYQLGMPELQIVPDRSRAADLGISVEDVATSINAMVGGLRVGKYSSDGRRLDVRLRLLANQRTRPEDFSRLRLRSSSGDLIPLSSLMTTEERPALQAITRRDRERAITIFANVAPGKSQDQALAYVESLQKKMPAGTRLVLGGASVAFRDSMGELLFAMMLGILVAYMVLASQFNSFLHPVTILAILPLAVAGAAFALLASGNSLNIFSMIGLLLLLGIVKKNSIILVDYTNQLRAQGMSIKDALLKAGPIRLRPILMTSIATLMAAVPPALGLGEGSEIRRPMAIAVIGGLVVSTALSLVVVPAFYLTVNRMQEKFRQKRALGKEMEPEVPGTSHTG
jgi:multidrug efflux pump subunit AcrB